jgi:hypothetical protein
MVAAGHAAHRRKCALLSTSHTQLQCGCGMHISHALPHTLSPSRCTCFPPFSPFNSLDHVQLLVCRGVLDDIIGAIPYSVLASAPIVTGAASLTGVSASGADAVDGTSAAQRVQSADGGLAHATAELPEVGTVWAVGATCTDSAPRQRARSWPWRCMNCMRTLQPTLIHHSCC